MGEGSRASLRPQERKEPSLPPLLPAAVYPPAGTGFLCLRPPVPRELGVPPPHRQKHHSAGTQGPVKIKQQRPESGCVLHRR